MTHHTVIVGAGVIGLTAAALMVSPRCRVTLIDPADGPPADDGDVGLRVSAIAAGSVDILNAADAWSRLQAERCHPYAGMCVWDAADAPDSPRAVRFNADEFGASELGYIVENAALQRALHSAVQASAVNLRYAARLDRVDIEARRVHLKSGEVIDYDLLVGADGLRSTIRELASIETATTNYQQDAVVTHLRPERPHEDTAWQRFLPSGPVALLPLADGRVSTVWSTGSDEAKSALDADDKTLGRLLTDATDAVLGQLVVEGPRGHFPLRANHAKDYVRTGVVLVGDAAHGIHPMAGQGANLGLRDVAALAEVVSMALAEGEHPGSRRVLRRYERARRFDNASMLNGLSALNRLFASETSLVGELRRNGMQLFNASGPIRAHAVKTAFGKSFS
ncbi:MAG: UbiH/UbiF/VisC/COQ6 family ubiquinone biosynthesis hydroxylase [Pseudomonadota bacterium]